MKRFLSPGRDRSKLRAGFSLNTGLGQHNTVEDFTLSHVYSNATMMAFLLALGADQIRFACGETGKQLNTMPPASLETVHESLVTGHQCWAPKTQPHTQAHWRMKEAGHLRYSI